MVETAGIEPASENRILTTTTCVVCLSDSSVLPGRQESHGYIPIKSHSMPSGEASNQPALSRRAIGSPAGVRSGARATLN